MPMRKPAARKLVRLLLEKRVSRINVLSDEFVDVMADMVMTYIDMERNGCQQREAEVRKGEQVSSLLSGVGVAMLFVAFEHLGDGPLAATFILAAVAMIGVALSRELIGV